MSWFDNRKESLIAKPIAMKRRHHSSLKKKPRNVSQTNSREFLVLKKTMEAYLPSKSHIRKSSRDSAEIKTARKKKKSKKLKLSPSPQLVMMSPIEEPRFSTAQPAKR